MNKTLGAVLSIVLGLLSYEAKAETNNKMTDHRLLVEKAINKFENSARRNWSFEVSRYENEEGDITSSVERFDPSEIENKRWTLIRVNGKQATEKQNTNFRKKISQKDNSASHSISLAEIVDLESLDLLKDDSSYTELSFNVDIEKLGKDAKGKLKGRLLYNKKNQFIETLVIKNTESFSPVFSANITELEIEFGFIHINQSVLPQKQNMVMKGTFAFFSEINEVSSDTYSNYQFIEG